MRELSFLTFTEGRLYVVTGQTGDLDPEGLTIDLAEKDNCQADLLGTWSPYDQVSEKLSFQPLARNNQGSGVCMEWISSQLTSCFQGFDQPHDVAASPDGDAVYVGEIGPNNIWKFIKV